MGDTGRCAGLTAVGARRRELVLPAEQWWRRPDELHTGSAASPTASHALTHGPAHFVSCAPCQELVYPWIPEAPRTMGQECSLGTDTVAGTKAPVLGFAFFMSGSFYQDVYPRGKGEGWTGVMCSRFLERGTCWLSSAGSLRSSHSRKRKLSSILERESLAIFWSIIVKDTWPLPRHCEG